MTVEGDEIVIVSCPGCATHYSHEKLEMAQTCRCSQCDERFPLAAAKKPYRLLPGGLVQADPLLAAGLESTQEQVDLPLQPVASIAPPVAAPQERFDNDDLDIFAPDADGDAELFGYDEESVPESIEPQADAEPRRPAHPLREALGVFLLAGLGGAAGFQGSMKFGVQPVNAIALGLGFGLTLGWIWIRWAERKR